MYVLLRSKAEKIPVLRPKYGKHLSAECRRMRTVRALVILARCHCKPFRTNSKYTWSYEEVIKSRREQLLVPKEENAYHFNGVKYGGKQTNYRINFVSKNSYLVYYAT